MNFELSSDQVTWYPAVVPGGVHESLLAAGVIEHPYFGDNEESVRWVDETTWWYRTTLTVDPAAAGERLVLVLPSVDTVAEISIDGEVVATSVNAFCPIEIDVTRRRLDGAELTIRIAPPLQDLDPPANARQIGTSTAWNLAFTRRRKPTFSWGWDFGPRVPSVGVIEQPYVRRDRYATAQWHVRTLQLDVAKAIAQVAIDVDVDAFATTADLVGTVTLTSPSGRTTTVELPLPARIGGARRATAVVVVPEAELWWTHDLGEPALYAVHAELRDGVSVVDAADFRVGLRTVELDRPVDPEQPGRLFRFLLNGVPTFSRGANWVPLSTLRGSVTREWVRRAIETARRGEMTMLRIWGGGAYEQDEFYDACDELGLLVWQDFMFACFDYPSEERAVQDEVAREAEFQVRRLRNHASMAVWCGNNEVHGIHHAFAGSLEPGDWGWHFFHSILPDAVSRLSPGAIYWPGSPWASEDPRVVNGVTDGDRHAWEVWHGKEMGAGGPTEFASWGEQVHWSRYGHDRGRFISEFGIHASPEQATLERWTPPGSLALRSAAFDGRNKDQPKDKGWAMMEFETGVPTTLTDYVDFSMACQAEGMKFAIEHYRRRQPHCNGTLVWQFNDVWPGFSWSVVDYDLVPKAGFYALQRAFRPVIASFRVHEGQLELWLTNSGRDAGELTLLVELQTLSGTQLLSEKVTAAAPGYSSAVVWTGAAPAQRDAFAWVSSPDGAIEPNRQFFAPLKELPFDGTLDVRAERTGPATARVELAARGFCYAARILTPAPGVVFDANYVDLRDGDRRVVQVSGLPESFDVATLEIRTYAG